VHLGRREAAELRGASVAGLAGLSVNGLFIGGAEQGFAFYSPRYGNALDGRKMLMRIKGTGTRSVSREASVTLRNLDYGEQYNPLSMSLSCLL